MQKLSLLGPRALRSQLSLVLLGRTTLKLRGNIDRMDCGWRITFHSSLAKVEAKQSHFQETWILPQHSSCVCMYSARCLIGGCGCVSAFSLVLTPQHSHLSLGRQEPLGVVFGKAQKGGRLVPVFCGDPLSQTHVKVFPVLGE